MDLDVNNENAYRYGIQLTKELSANRKQARMQRKIVDRATKSLSIQNDEGWAKICDDANIQLNDLNEKYKTLYEKFRITKMGCNKQEWKILLTKWGYILSENSEVKHVKDCINNTNNVFFEEEVMSAVNDTVSAIKYLEVDLNNSIQNKDIDLANIIKSQIKWFVNDLKHHRLGVQVLEQIQTEKAQKVV